MEAKCPMFIVDSVPLMCTRGYKYNRNEKEEAIANKWLVGTTAGTEAFRKATSRGPPLKMSTLLQG